MSNAPWFRWFAADYRRKTLHLSFIEDSAYRRLIDAYMDRRSPLPCDPAALYRLCSAQDDAERAAVDRVIKEFFTNGDGRLKHRRCDVELENQKKQQKQRIKSASNAARMRWASEPQCVTVCGKMPDSDSDSDSDSSSKPSADSKPTPARKRATPSASLPAGLAVSADLWQAFREQRKAQRAPMTQRVESLLAKRLQDLVANGEDGAKVVEQSIERGWKGLFAVDRGNARGKETQADKRAKVAKAIWGDRTGESNERTIDGTSERVD